MVFVYIIGICLLLLLLFSYSVFCIIFMPRKTLSLRKNKQSIKDDAAVTEQMKNKYLAIYREITIPGVDGNTLTAYCYSQKGVSSWIVFLHGYRGSSSNMLKYMEHFRTVGNFNLLAVDLSGHSKRNEKYFLLGSAAETDNVMQWVNWIKSNNENAHIVLYGVSLGGATSINTAGRNPSVFDGVITDSAPSSFEAMIRRILHHKCGIATSLIMPIVFWYARNLAKLKIEETASVEQAANVDCSILLIHSKDDHFVPIKMMHEIFGQLTVNDKKYLEISGAEHTHSVDVDSKAYWTEVDKFMQKVFSDSIAR